HVAYSICQGSTPAPSVACSSGVYASAGSSAPGSCSTSTRATPPFVGCSPPAARCTVTQMRPAATATPRGLPPTSIVATTRSARGSMRDRVPSLLFATQTPPRPTTSPEGELPTPIVVRTELVAGTIRTTASSSASATQTPPSPAASAVGGRPTLIGVNRSGGSRRVTVSAYGSALQRAPAARATAPGQQLCVSTVPMTRARAGSTRASGPTPPEAAQTPC